MVSVASRLNESPSLADFLVQVGATVLLARNILVKLYEEPCAGHPIRLSSKKLFIGCRLTGQFFDLLSGMYRLMAVVDGDCLMIVAWIERGHLQWGRRPPATPHLDEKDAEDQQRDSCMHHEVTSTDHRETLTDRCAKKKDTLVLQRNSQLTITLSHALYVSTTSYRREVSREVSGGWHAVR